MEFRRNHALISGMGAPPTDEETKDESLNSVDIRCRKMNERGMRAEHRPSVRGGGWEVERCCVVQRRVEAVLAKSVTVARISETGNGTWRRSVEDELGGANWWQRWRRSSDLPVPRLGSCCWLLYRRICAGEIALSPTMI